MRRKTLLGRLRPDLVVKDIRGNIGTRLRKLEEGMYDGVMLSEAGIMRLGINRRFVHRFDPQTFYPAPGQGVIALETRTRDAASRSLCAQTGDDNQRIKSEAEFALLRAVGFDCRAPIGAITILDGSVLTMKGFIVKLPGGNFVERQAQGSSSDPAGVGSHLATLFLSA
jgi:hydroxymethylbilane synthase